MPFTAQVYRLFIASPSDVAKERQVIREVVSEWNAAHAVSKNIVILPVGWDSHAIPQMGRRPQEAINHNVLNDCDFLVGVFWMRLGSEAGKGMTGSQEEVEVHLKANKPAMLYFSDKAAKPSQFNSGELEKLKAFKQQIQDKRSGQYATFDDENDFRAKLTAALAIMMNRYDSTGSTTVARDLEIPTDDRYELASVDEEVCIEYSARSSRMRRGEGELSKCTYSWKEVFMMFSPLISAGGIKTELKSELERQILVSVRSSGAKTKYGTDYEHVEVPEGEFARIIQHFQLLGFITQSLVVVSLTDSGKNLVRSLATRKSKQ